MKKYLFLLLLVSAVSANAQTFDEADLIGTWTTTGLSYPPYQITDIASITLGEGIYQISNGGIISNYSASGMVKMTYFNFKYSRSETNEEKIPDYYISNNNKLHICIGNGYALHFIIEELTATTLKVKTYDGNSYTFTKTSSSSAVKSLSVTRSTDESIYNLSGQKVENVTADGIYIQNGQKKVIKK